MRVPTPILLITTLACALPASAQHVYKCAAHGVPIYQSSPCSGEPLKTWDATPQPLNPNVQARIAAIERELQQSNRRPRHRSSSTTARRGRPADACEQARRGRAKAYAKAGLKRDFALSSHWDNRVHDACW